MMIRSIKNPNEKRRCRTPGCKVSFRPERGLLNFRFCRDCTFARKKAKRAHHKLGKKPYGEYPHARFQQVRKQLSSGETEKRCGICGITAKQHVEEYGIDLHLDHVLPARFVVLMAGDPHDERNLMWLCVPHHGRKRKAEERLRGKEGQRGFILQLQIERWDMSLVKYLFQQYGIPTERLPFYMSECTSLEEFNTKFAANQKISGRYMETTMHVPCGFCAEPDWLIHTIIDTQEAYTNGSTCKSCGRGVRGIFKQDQGGVAINLVQFCGDDPPAWFPYKIERVNV